MPPFLFLFSIDEHLVFLKDPLPMNQNGCGQKSLFFLGILIFSSMARAQLKTQDQVSIFTFPQFVYKLKGDENPYIEPIASHLKERFELFLKNQTVGQKLSLNECDEWKEALQLKFEDSLSSSIDECALSVQIPMNMRMSSQGLRLGVGVQAAKEFYHFDETTRLPDRSRRDYDFEALEKDWFYHSSLSFYEFGLRQFVGGLKLIYDFSALTQVGPAVFVEKQGWLKDVSLPPDVNYWLGDSQSQNESKMSFGFSVGAGAGVVLPVTQGCSLYGKLNLTYKDRFQITGFSQKLDAQMGNQVESHQDQIFKTYGGEGGALCILNPTQFISLSVLKDRIEQAELDDLKKFNAWGGKASFVSNRARGELSYKANDQVDTYLLNTVIYVHVPVMLKGHEWRASLEYQLPHLQPRLLRFLNHLSVSAEGRVFTRKGHEPVNLLDAEGKIIDGAGLSESVSYSRKELTVRISRPIFLRKK